MMYVFDGSKWTHTKKCKTVCTCFRHFCWYFCWSNWWWIFFFLHIYTLSFWVYHVKHHHCHSVSFSDLFHLKTDHKNLINISKPLCEALYLWISYLMPCPYTPTLPSMNYDPITPPLQCLFLGDLWHCGGPAGWFLLVSLVPCHCAYLGV